MTDASKAADLLAELVRFPTQQAGPERGAGDELALCNHLAERLNRLDPDKGSVGDCTRSDGSPGAYVFAHWGDPHRVINAHVDTVPANAGWSRSPWEPYQADGRLYGLGSADTKGAIAATLVALDGARPRNRGVLFSGDEEAGSAVMTEFLASPYARHIREVIVCEPTARTAGTRHRGILAQRAIMDGPGGHSSKADHLPAPVAQLSRLASSLFDAGTARISDGPPGMTGICMNVASIDGGVAYNVIPAHAELAWSIRPYPGFDTRAWTAEVEQRARAIAPAISIHSVIDHAPFACDALAPLVAPFAARTGSLDFWTEAAMWAAAGVDAIVIGPGDIAQAHAADEWVSLDDLGWATELFRTVLS